MKILLHTCCAPCLIGPYQALVDEGHEVGAYFYNPNIHPLIEFRRRLKALKLLQERVSVPLISEEEYGLLQYLRAVGWDGPDRCGDCYRLRLARTASKALEAGFQALSTTLLSSAHQNHELIADVGEECAAEQGLAFAYRDWRPLAAEGHLQARRMGLYRQQYCGCLFSEWERYRDTGRHLYRSQDTA